MHMTSLVRSTVQGPHREVTWHLEQQALSLSISFLHWLWSKLFFDKHSWMRQHSFSDCTEEHGQELCTVT